MAHPRGLPRAIFNKSEAELEGDEKTPCPLSTHYAS